MATAGGVYELELYPVVRNVAGVPPGMYHYDSFDHVLRPVAAGDSPAILDSARKARRCFACSGGYGSNRPRHPLFRRPADMPLMVS